MSEYLPGTEGSCAATSVKAPSHARLAVAVALVLFGASGAHAGDILRGGTSLGQRNGKAAPGTLNAVAEQARVNAKDMLARTTAAVNSVKAMQDAARAAALVGPNNLGLDPNSPGRILPNVPDGLVRGGLQVARAVPKDLAHPQAGENAKLWSGAKLPQQTSADGRVKILVLQTKPQAVLNWETFNVGKKTTLTFNQDLGKADKSQWTVFNKISDPSGSPSQILGRIEAPGQVYVINPNGILFGGSSQINLHSLVASSLPINDGLIKRGLLNNPASDFLFSWTKKSDSAFNFPVFNPAPDAENTFLRTTLEPTVAGTISVTASTTKLMLGTDYTLTRNADGKSVLRFTASGIKKFSGQSISINYFNKTGGDVVVQAGAQLTSPTTGAGIGGRISLVGPNVRNDGTISTPDGQTILAAGLQVGFVAHSSDDPRLRGLDTFIGATGSNGGRAVNNGFISVPRANITIAGSSVAQNGVIESSTSVSLNGTINLLANFNAIPYVEPSFSSFTTTASGPVSIGADAVNQILPDLADAKTVIGDRLALRSKVTIEGRNIHFGKNSTLFAPNADVAVRAGEWLGSGEQKVLTFSAGQIYVDEGATLSVAGTADVNVPIAQNILSLELRGAELANSPLQRKGPLRGPTLNLDSRQRGTFAGRDWIGTPLGDATGYVNLIEHNVGELSTAGGTISLAAGDAVVVRKGAKLDVSGGYVSFEGGLVKTTRVMSDGRVVDIANATPDRPFTGLYDGTFTTTHPKYSVSETWAQPLALSSEHFEPGYVQGKDSGNIVITAASVALGGELRGETIAGPRQRTATLEAKLSALTLAFEKQDGSQNTLPRFSPTPPSITFQNGVLPEPSEFTANAAPLSIERLARVFLSPELFTTSGFGNITITNAEGDIIVPEDVELKVRARGSLTLAGANVDVLGKVTAPSGALSFTAHNLTPYTEQKFPIGTTFQVTPNLGRGNFTLGPNAALNIAGLVVDDRLLSRNPLALPLATDGGSVSIAGYNVALAVGSAIDASGGVVFDRAGKRTYGNGGSISIKAGNDPKTTQIIGGTLALGAKLSAFSGGKGGALTIQAPSIQIGGELGATVNTLVLQPEFFSTGGFTNFILTGLGERIAGSTTAFVPAVVIAPSTQLSPVAENWIAFPYGPGLKGPELRTILQPQALRTPVSLSFSAPGLRDDANANALVTRGDIVFGEGARIATDPGGAVSFSGETVALYGSVFAPSGRISISGSRNLGVAFNESAKSLTSVLIGANAVLSTKGTTLYTPNLYGFHTGSVLPGGSISVSGNIVAQSGALLDVSGTSGTVDTLAPFVKMGGDVTGISVVPQNSGVNTSLYTRAYVSEHIESDAGSITLAGGQHLFNDATLLGAAGGSSALGGTLTVSSGRFNAPGHVQTPLDVTLQIIQSGLTLPSGAETAIGKAVFGAAGIAHFTADTFTHGGFDVLTLRGTVEFSGPVRIDARRTLSVADAGVLFADSNVTLKAPYVTLGQAFLPPLAVGSTPRTPFLDAASQPVKVLPTYGTGKLTVIADLIDIGNLSLQYIGNARFIADDGDIRGDGTLEAAGHIFMRAGQVYPPSATTFTIIAADYKVGDATLPGSVSFAASGIRALPISAGGTLNVFASDITQNGTLRVPLGTINLGWNGEGDAPVSELSGEKAVVTKTVTLGAASFTSVSAVSPVEGQNLVVPFGLNINGVTWIDPTGLDITGGGVAQKTINIAASNVNSMAGSRLDIRGGGDLLSYRWVAGIGGSRDLLSSTTSFAVLPGYGAHFSPYSPNSSATALTGDVGFVNGALRVGDSIHLGAGAGLEEGNYTLLPARYALLPGARLVTLKGGTPIGTLNLPDGSTLVPGYRYNGLNAERTVQPHLAWFEVLSPRSLGERADYASYLGSEFLSTGAQLLDTKIPRLPTDAGQLTLQASNSMQLNGRVSAGAQRGSRGGIVDIASPVDIVITGKGGDAGPGKLTLDASQLNSFGAESLLIGGIRKVGADSTVVTVKTGNLIVNNAGTPLVGPEIILVANKNLTLAAGAEILQKGNLGASADMLVLGKSTTPGSGDGTLLRVSADPSASIVRQGITTSTEPHMEIGAGVHIAGVSVTLDSTYGTSLDPSARLDATVIALNSGQISIQLNEPGPLGTTYGLVLAGTALHSLEKSSSVSLLSYSTFDIYGTGAFNVAGHLALHAAAIRGFNNGGGTASISGGSSFSITPLARPTPPLPARWKARWNCAAAPSPLAKASSPSSSLPMSRSVPPPPSSAAARAD